MKRREIPRLQCPKKEGNKLKCPCAPATEEQAPIITMHKKKRKSEPKGEIVDVELWMGFPESLIGSEKNIFALGLGVRPHNVGIEDGIFFFYF